MQKRRLAGWIRAFWPWVLVLVWVAPAVAQGTGVLPPPTVRPLSSTSVAISWATTARLNTQIWYGPAGGATLHAYNYLLVTAHAITLTGLNPGVTYSARTESSNYSNPDLWSPAFTFSTAPVVATLRLSPAAAALAIGQSQQFSASYSDGSPVGALAWAVTDGGTVSASGRFTAATSGSFTLTATDAQNRSAAASLSITAKGTGALPPPAISPLSGTSVAFSWTTAQPLNTQIWYGPVGGATLHAYNYLLVKSHAISLTGLTPGVTYQAQTESSNYSNPDLWSPVFTFATAAAPATMSDLEPKQGPIAGGTIVSIAGAGFAPGATVAFGGAAAGNLAVNGAGTLMQATAPPGTAGNVLLSVTNPGSTAATSSFTYTNLAPGCGSDCGNVGDPYQGQGPPPNAVPIFGCTLIQVGGAYVLGQDVSGTIRSSDSYCLHVFYTDTPVVIDLGGHTVNGIVKVESNAPGSYELMNGAVICNVGDRSCLYWSVPYGHIHHLTVENQSPTPQANIDINAIVPATVTAPILKLDHITSTVAATAAQFPRSRNIMDDGANGGDPTQQSVPIEAFNNLITCADDASACQGVELYDAPYAYVHNNQINLPTHCGACADSARGILFDQLSNDGVAAYNRIDVEANRAVRVRATKSISIHDNEFDNIGDLGRLAAIQVGETNAGIDDDFVNVFNNAFQLGAGGAGVTSASAADVYVYANTVSCVGNDCSAAGPLAKTDIPDTLAADQTGGTINAMNNDVSSLDAANVASVHICGYTGGTAYDCGGSNLPAATTTGYVCNNGAVAPTGHGVIKLTTPPCPPPPPPPEPQPFQP